MSDSHARLVQELTPVVAAAGADLEELAVSKAGRRSVVRVVIDGDNGVTLDDVAAVSRALSEALDELDAREPALLAGAYVLEVSSPGVDRPLTAPRHWRRNLSRLVTVHLADGTSVTGRVLRADEDAATGALVLEIDGAERSLAYAEIVRGQIQVEFNRPGAALDEAAAEDDDADDADDADEIDPDDDTDPLTDDEDLA